MKKLDANFNYLIDMYEDSYYPKVLVDKLKLHIVEVVDFIEASEHTTEEIQEQLDKMTIAINDLQDEFYANDSELETVARESIAETVNAILQHFNINIEIEEAIRERDW
ncbi:DUF5713 family protein [Solibacillus sp. FSL K6-1523]|uniref:DUF5713 family protein n=1 Tax=Solibacillus sp. FSL K6-1523 TaxID=2921471 RepID=UPI0030FB3393